MATVYLAHDLRHERKVAIKVLRPELAAVIGAERFLREIKTIAHLQHPHILGLIDSRRGRRHRVLRHAVRRGRIAPRPAPAREAAPRRRGRADRHRGRRRARLRPPPRRDPSRHQARERPAPRRPGAGRRLRHRPRDLQRRRQPHDRDRHVARHAALHVARAGDGRARDHRPLRRLRARRGDLRDAGGRAAVHRPHGAGDHRQGAHRRAAAAYPARKTVPPAVEARGAHRAGQAPGRPVRQRRGVFGGADRAGAPAQGFADRRPGAPGSFSPPSPSAPLSSAPASGPSPRDVAATSGRRSAPRPR